VALAQPGAVQSGSEPPLSTAKFLSDRAQSSAGTVEPSDQAADAKANPRRLTGETGVRSHASRTPVLLASIRMDTNTLLIIVVLILLLGGGGFYFRGR
jgi:hypothetical protein